MKIIILNVKYSTNVGDGVIAECIEHSLKNIMPGIEIESLDLGGRESYGDSGVIKAGNGIANRMKDRILPLYHMLPPAVRMKVSSVLTLRSLHKNILPRWKKRIGWSDAIILGGGHIFSDIDLYFPLRIYEALKIAAPKKIPVFVYAVGVSKEYSPKGHKYLKDALGANHVAYAAQRDDLSQSNWRQCFTTPSSGIVRDPGVLARDVYGPRVDRPRARKRVGISVIGDASRNNPDKQIDLFAGDARLYWDAAVGFVERGHDVIVFTNGAVEDEAVKAGVAKILKAEGEKYAPHITVAERPKTPQELADIIKGLDGMVARRLHANIVAYSYGVPHVGLGRGGKHLGFFESVGRTRYLLPSEEISAERIVSALEDAMADPVPAAERERVIAESRQDLGNVLSLIQKTSRKTGGPLITSRERYSAG